MEDHHLPLYDRLKNLYQETKQIWKGVYFELLFEPVDKAVKYIVTERLHFTPRFKKNDEGLSFDELFAAIATIKFYKIQVLILLRDIALFNEARRNQCRVSLLRVMEHPDEEDEIEAEPEPEEDSEDEPESGSETESASEAESDDDMDWQSVRESDSGLESHSSRSYSSVISDTESEYDSDWE